MTAITVGPSEDTAFADTRVLAASTLSAVPLAKPGGLLIQHVVPMEVFFSFSLSSTTDRESDYQADEDDALVREYVSRLWAEDWDSPEDSVYDG